MRLRVGIVSGEFLQPGATRIGGFGWGAAHAAQALRAAGDEPLFVCPDVEALNGAPAAFGDVPLVAKHGGALPFARALRRARPDVLLSIDYRPSYDGAFKALPRTPLVIWVRDPRPPADVARVAQIRIPGRPPDERPQGLGAIDCTPLRSVVRWSRLVRRPVMFASPAPDALTPKAPETYGHDPGRLALLPNPVDVAREPGPKAPAPRVAFLARLDPYKRPWLFVELARAFPGVEFVMLGQSHFQGPGSWAPRDLPANLSVLGNLPGEAKLRELDAAWVLVNTAAHEGLPVSFQEALASRTPLLACVDTEQVVSRFGIYAGSFPGDGLAGLPSLRAGLERLLGDRELRERLGREGREWICGRHTPERFVAALRSLAASGA
jgi:glycosyltransferase involved in cell wall biosynthesis